MKPGDRTIHRSQQNHPQVTLLTLKHPPQGFSLHTAFPLGVRKAFRRNSRAAPSRSGACLETSRRALQILGGNPHSKSPRSELAEKLKAPHSPKEAEPGFWKGTIRCKFREGKPRSALGSSNKSEHALIRSWEAATLPHEKLRTQTPTRKH